LFENFKVSQFFEVEILLKYFSSDFLFNLIALKEGKEVKLQLVRNLIDRFACNSNSNFWLNWLSSGLVRKFLRSFFAEKSFALVQKTETLISILENCENYPQNFKEMLRGTFKSITL